MKTRWLSMLTKPRGSDMGLLCDLTITDGGPVYAQAEAEELANFNEFVMDTLRSDPSVTAAVRSTIEHRQAVAHLNGLGKEIQAVNAELAKIPQDTVDPELLRERRQLNLKLTSLHRAHTEQFENEAIARKRATAPRRVAEEAIMRLINGRHAELRKQADKLKDGIVQKIDFAPLLVTLARQQCLNGGIANALFDRLIEANVAETAAEPALAAV